MRPYDAPVRLTKNPFQRAAAVCIFIALILSVAGIPAAGLGACGVGVVFAAIAVKRQDRYRD
jgi:hypothetical protein